MSDISPNKTLDARGLQCPMPVVKTSQEVKNIAVGEILEIIATDPGSIVDINAWAKSTGNEMLKMEKGEGTFTFYVRRVN